MIYPAAHAPASFIECPVHQLAVAVNTEGRITGTCRDCLTDAVHARVRMLRKLKDSDGS